MKWHPILFFLVIICNKVHMCNILALLPLPLYSHTANFMPIFKALAARGHNVTVVSPFPQKSPVPNLTDIVMPFNLDEFVVGMPTTDLTKVSERLFQFIGLWKFAGKITELSLSNEIVQKLIRDKDSNFDLILLETFVFQEPFVAFGHKFNAPIINLHPSVLPASAAYYTGNHIPYSYSPTRFSTFTDQMTFLQRAETAFFHTWELLVNTLYYVRYQEYLMRKYLEHSELQNLPPLREMLMNTSLTLINHNSAVGYPFPVHKNVIEFGGINVKSGDKLPEDLQELMDNVTEGVVYFSFGSYFNISTLSPAIKASLVSALGKLKQKVLIKWEKPTNNEKLPNNIEFRNWYPQSSVLAHPNCKLFITHGGIHSLMEGIYHAVPLLLIPLFADQNYNAKFAERNGIGKVLRLRKLNEEKLLNNINSLLHNPSYKENIKEKSAIFKDTPTGTLSNVIFWIEYVIRYKGAPHLRPAGLDLYWFQGLLLDIIAAYLLILIIIVYIIKIVLRFTFRSLGCLIYKKSCEKYIKKWKKE